MYINGRFEKVADTKNSVVIGLIGSINSENIEYNDILQIARFYNIRKNFSYRYITAEGAKDRGCKLPLRNYNSFLEIFTGGKVVKRKRIGSFTNLKHGDKIISPFDNEVTEFYIDKNGGKYLASKKSLFNLYQFDADDFYIYDGNKEVGEVDSEYFDIEIEEQL